MAYDKMKWHLGGEFPHDLPEENAGTHIGMFLAWCFRQGWAGALHRERSPKDVRGVIDGRMTGREFLESHCDGTLNEEDLGEEGNAFARAYYETDAYEEDYQKTFVRRKTPTMYHVKDSQGAYDRIAQVLNKPYRQWRRSVSKRTREEAELEASGTARGVLDLTTGELIFSDPDFRLGPKTKLSAFMGSEGGKVATIESGVPPWTSVTIHGTPKLGDVPMDVFVHFQGDKPYMLTLCLADDSPPENPWDPKYQEEKNAQGNAWLTRVFGTAREFSWGTIKATYDQRSGTSGVYFRYH